MVIYLHQRNNLNYLAHYYLADGDEGLIVGNMLADYLHGNKYKSLPVPIQRGVVLHRMIDDFTDSHPEVEKTKARLREKYRKYAPVISDVFYDYSLGSNWNEYHSESLKEFSAGIYKTLFDNVNMLPDHAKMMLSYMSKNDWLYHYSTFYGIEMALKGLSRRAKFETRMHEAIDDLKRDHEMIETEFKVFFKELRSLVKDFKD